MKRKQLAEEKSIHYNKIEKDERIPLTVIPAILAILLLCAAAVWGIIRYVERTAASAPAPPPTLVIDAGHGGFDGGAISEDGTRESDINLAIALRLESIVRFCGQKTEMTRWDDSRKTDILSYSEREDLKSRVDKANAEDNAVLVSIHQNYYPTAQPKGAQVLYSTYGSSDRLGKRMQELLVEKLDPENRRLAMPAPSELYLTANARCPTVLVECGFMSNNFEVLKLKECGYQTKLALVIAAACLEYVSGESPV